jgi:hypothetical protein
MRTHAATAAVPKRCSSAARLSSSRSNWWMWAKVVAHEVGVRHQQLRAQSCLALAQPAALGADLSQLVDRMAIVHGIVLAPGLACIRIRIKSASDRG